MFSVDVVKQHTGLSDEQVTMLTQTFLEEVRVSYRKLDACFTAGDWTGICKLAHMIKPSYFLMGINEGVPIIDYLLSIDPVQPNLAQLEIQVLRFRQLAISLERELVYILQDAALALNS